MKAILLWSHRNRISGEVARRLKECKEFLADYGLLKGGVGDLPLTDELWGELWQKFLDTSNPLTKSFEKDLKPEFTKQEKEVLENIRKHPPTESIITGKELTSQQKRFIDLWMFDQEEWVKEFSTTGAPHIGGALNAGGVSTLNSIGSDITFNLADAGAERYIKSQSLSYAKEINKTTEKILRNKMGIALESGESIRDVTKAIVGDVNAIYTHSRESRAKMIAQTETIGAVNKGSIEGSVQSGVVWGHTWLAAMDAHTRDDHSAIHGESVALGDSFPVVDLEYPGQPGGDASQVINCRCTLKPLTKKPK